MSLPLPQPLPRDWVERLFSRFLVRYGVAWTRMWEGVDPQAVMADWSDQLAGLQDRQEALKYALRYLPIDKPPTVHQFKAICDRAPPPPAPALPPAPAAEPGRVAQALEKLRTFQANSDPLSWAHALRAREEAGEVLSSHQREAWRRALLHAPVMQLSPGEFTPPPRDKLPPGMLSGRNEPLSYHSEGTP